MAEQETFFDFAAAVGMTKHPGEGEATRELARFAFASGYLNVYNAPNWRGKARFQKGSG